MKVKKIINLTSHTPQSGMNSGNTTGPSTDGTRLILMKKKRNEYYFCLDGAEAGLWLSRNGYIRWSKLT